jgi:hypothetical protein
MLKAVTGEEVGLGVFDRLSDAHCSAAALPQKLAGPVVDFWRNCDMLPLRQ